MVTLLQLEYFRALAGTQNVTKTARQLNVSQSTLTGVIRRLETELNTQLFTREGRSIRLNEYGQRYLQYVQQVFRSLQSAQLELEAMKDSKQKQITFNLLGANVWLPAIEAFQSQYPDIALRHMEYYGEQCIPKLLSGQVDLSFECCMPFQEEGLDSVTIFETVHYALVPEAHPLAGRKTLRLKDLEGQPLVGLNDMHTGRSLLDYFFAQAGIVPRWGLEGGSTIVQPHAKPRMISIVTDFSVAYGIPEGTVSIPITDAHVHCPVKAYWRKGRTLTPAMLRLIDCFREYLEAMPQP